ncbi:MAG: response regulator [Anaerolineales bacterium]
MPKHVMVLEDEPVLFELLEGLLSLEGYRVSKLASLEHLVPELKTDRPDAVLIDVNLKGANGLDLLGKIRSDQELKGMVVLLTSGADYRQEAEDRGADGFLMKPYMPDDLISVLRQKLGE